MCVCGVCLCASMCETGACVCLCTRETCILCARALASLGFIRTAGACERIENAVLARCMPACVCEMHGRALGARIILKAVYYMQRDSTHFQIYNIRI